ncbi:MAG TPA: hypothetical protein DEA08_01255 [Planctomycetes bacterium]|nr:hypothetical protein [Planctomycetota bacterium]
MQEIAAELNEFEVPESFPELSCALPHTVEAFRAQPEDLPDVLEEVQELFLRAAEQGLAVDVRWHPNT